MHASEAREVSVGGFFHGMVLGAILLVAVFVGSQTSVDGAASTEIPLGAPTPPDIPTAVTPTVVAALSDFFTENAGQVANPEVLYYARGSGVSVGFAAGAVLVNMRERPPHEEFDPRAGPTSHAPSDPEAPATPLRGHLVRIAFEGANPVVPRARGEFAHRANFFLGDDPARWRTDVRNYAEIVYEDAWDGIDVVYRPSPGGVKYDLVVHPGADLADVAFAYEGVTDLAVTPHGLTAETSLGPLLDDLPATWQASGLPVECALRQIADHTVGYACSGWDGSGDLVIDPLLYSTFLGGSGSDGGLGIAVDASGSAYVTGVTGDAATDFPTTPGAYNTTHNGGQDAFMAKMDASGSALVYATFLGGSGIDVGLGMAVDASGAAYLTGYTTDAATDFPTTPGAYDTTHNGGVLFGYDAFVAKLDATGSSLLYSTFLGGSGSDEGSRIAVDASGSAYVTGFAYDDATDFPTTPGAYNTTHNGGWEAFASKLDAAGSTLLYSTFLGGSGDDLGWGIAVDALGAAYVTGWTRDDVTDFPTTLGAYDTTHNGGQDAFVAKLDASGSSLLYATFLGGSGADQALGIAIDASGAAYVTGGTFDDVTDFPTTAGAYDTTHNGGTDAFVAKLDASGSALLYSTFIGGNSTGEGRGIAIDASGAAYVTGFTIDSTFPTTPGAYDTTHNGGDDVFVAKLDANGGALLYSTFLGGSGDDVGWGIVIDASGAAYVTGSTWDDITDFPTTPGVYDTTHNGGVWDAFMTKLGFPSIPVLSATGEPNYVVDGLDPEAGTLAALYAYRANYTDADGDPPAVGDPKVHILKGGVEIAGSPFPLVEVDPLDSDFTDGKWYAYNTTLAPRGTDYTYHFTATDAMGLAAADWPSPAADAPDVLSRAPSADAGPDQSGVFRNATVQLNGAGSSDPDGDPLTYAWVQMAGPAVTLNNASVPVANFTPTGLGTYTFQLTVDDGMGANSTDEVTATVVNRPPTAEAGSGQTGVLRNATTSLDGAVSSDPDGDPLTFAWTQTAGPAVALTGANTAAPSFTPVAAGVYIFQLVVGDGLGGTDADNVTVTVVNRAPTADAGGPYTCTAGGSVTLIGTGSIDPDGDTLTYTWTVPLTPPVTLSGPTPTLTCPTTVGTLNVTLTVTDPDSLSSNDGAPLSVQPGPGGPAAVTDWTWLLLVLIAVMAVLLFLFFLWRKRKQRGETTETPPTAPPPNSR